jgi:hypothetical protein
MAAPSRVESLSARFDMMLHDSSLAFPWVARAVRRVPGRARFLGSLAAHLLLGCFVLFAPSGLRAQAGDQPPSQETPPQESAPPPASGQFKLGGTVVNAATGEPIRRALVQVEAESGPSVLTDSNGHFEFNGVPGGPANVTARKPGFFSDEELALDAVAPLPISVGPDTQPIVVKLTPESVISGRVKTAEGEPLENVPIRVISSRVIDGRKRWEPRASGTTNEDGEFRVANLPPGTYYVETGQGANSRARRGRRFAAGSEEGYPTTFYPGVPEPSAAAPVVLSAGQQQELEFSLKPEPVFKLSGIVTGYLPNMGVDLEFVDKLGEPLALPTQFDAQTGKFSTKIPAGSYSLRVRAQDAKQSASANLPINVSADAAGLQVILGAGLSIPVTVRMESSTGAAAENPPAGRRNGGAVAVRLSSSESPLSSLDFWATPADSQKDHSLAVRNIEPGKYIVDVVSSGSWYAQSVTCGSTDLMRDDLVVAAGSQLPPIEVALRDDGATLTGTVQSDGALEKGVVVLVPDHAASAQAKVSQTGPGGEFRFDRLAPGDYRVLAFDRTNDLEYRNPDVMNAYLSRGVHVSLQPNGQANTAVELITVGK